MGGDTEKRRRMRWKEGWGKGKDCSDTQRGARCEGHLRVIWEERESWLKLDF